MAYRVSTIVTYINPSLPGIAQLSPSDQPAPPLCGAFFFYGHDMICGRRMGDPLRRASHSNADAGPAMAVPAFPPEKVLEEVQQRRRQGIGQLGDDFVGAVIGIDRAEREHQQNDPGPDWFAPLRRSVGLLR